MTQNLCSWRVSRLAFLSTAALLLLTVAVPAADLPRGDAGAAGFSPEKLQRIDALLAELVEREQIAGGAVLVARHGNVVHLATAGWRDREAEAPVAADTILRIASMTKPVTSVAALMLVEDGRLRLSDPVSKYIPEFARPVVLVAGDAAGDGQAGGPSTVPAEREITVHDLLTHTSGISYRFIARPHLGEKYAEAGVSDGLVETPGTMADNVRRLAACPLLFQPGTAWEYGLNTDVLGRVIEVASGQTLEAFFRERLFEPLGMSDTHFVVPAEKRPRLAAVYTPGDDRGIRRVGSEPVTAGLLTWSATYSTRDESRYHSGGAGLCSTIGDYFRFLEMLRRGGELDGVRLLKADSVAQMTRNQIGDLTMAFAAHGSGFGYGFGIVTAPGTNEPASVGSYSWGGFFNTYFWVDPQRELVGVMMTQIHPNGHLTLRQDAKRLTYEALLE